MVRATLANTARGWVTARAEDLLPVEYSHVVFTMPPEIARIAYLNKKAVYWPWVEVSKETILTLAADPNRLGARVGMTSVLHIWGSALMRNPHIHMIVPGWQNAARWRALDRLPSQFIHACGGHGAAVTAAICPRAVGGPPER